MSTEPSPVRLKASTGIAFIGCHLYGAGFMFEDGNDDANSTAEMRRLLLREPAAANVVHMLISGQDITTSPTVESSRWALNFRNLNLETVASKWPESLRIVEERVRPGRAKLGGYSVARSRAERWWLYGTYAASLYERLASVRRCLVLSQVCARFALAFAPVDRIYTHSVCVIALDSWSAFTVLQGSVHELWARFFSSTLEDRLRYTSKDCFDTFPFPPDWTTSPTLEATGEAYYTFRADLMVRNDEGLTKTYNRFHDPDEHDPDIVRLRELHAAMDRAVLDAYGWTDVPTDCEFLLDYEIDEETWGNKKKPWRYRWPDDVRDDVLARLLELNKQRAEEEALAGKAGKAEKKPGKPRRKKAPKGQGSLF